MAGDNQDEVLAFMARPETYGLSEPVRRIDTHGAMVFLAGDQAYKIKRAIRYPFMDFSTLEKRMAVCLSEIAVNRFNAPAIYKGVVPIRRTSAGLRLGGEGAADGGDIVEWAVHMQRFDENATLDHFASEHAWPADLTAQLALMAVTAHKAAPVITDREKALAAVKALGVYISRNAEALAARPDLFDLDRVLALKTKARAQLAELDALLTRRALSGYVRRCHGDMHLRNIVMIDGKPVLFDAIEFDEGIATIDTLYDLAFLLMDLWERGLHAEANGVFNRYLWAHDDEADYAGLAALPLFLSIRAGIRAMVTTAAIQHLEGDARRQAENEAQGYFILSEGFLAQIPARLVGVGGLSGSGKSTLAARLAPVLGHAPGAVHLRSDIERKAMFGVGEYDPLPANAYAAHVSGDVYARLRHRAELALKAGQGVIVDAVHARSEERDALAGVAVASGAGFAGLWLEAAQHVLEQRVEERAHDASDATAEVVRKQAAYELGRMNWARLRSDRNPDEVSMEALQVINAS